MLDKRMHTITNKSLQVYAASAGSGKTHRLVLTYLKILLSDPNYGQKFRNIVAMTFTNKAANEMKERILQTLSGIAFEHHASQKSNALKQDLIAETKLSEQQIKERSAIALQGILHHYEDFNISTIDKFNLKLIRSFSRDLNLPADFEVIINEKLVLDEVLDLLFAKLGQADFEELTKMMLAYAKTKVADGESWDFKKSLMQFSEVLGKENNIEEIKLLFENSYSHEAYKALVERKEKVKSDFLAKCSEAYLLAAPFKGINFKTPTDQKRIDALVNDSNWGLGKQTGPFYASGFLSKLQENKFDLPSEVSSSLIELSDAYQRDFAKFSLLEAQRKNFFNMALLQYVAIQISELMALQKQIRISEFNQLISQLVQGESAPYIYERLGIRFEHFLLDEFQDTSRLQWVNMIPLILEAISNNRSNLIVGDAKQSIYRFNNGLAEQFVSLPKLYNPEDNPELSLISKQFESNGEKISLKNNFRSAPQIVAFNNALFENLAGSLSSEKKDFYSDLRQDAKSNKQGYIRIETLLNKLPNELLHQKIISTIDDLLNDGFRPCDICILTERNKTGNSIAMALTQAGKQVVSQDSLLIYSNPVVQLFLIYLKKRARPSNSTLGKRLAEAYLRVHKKFDASSFMSYFKTVQKDAKTYRYFDEKAFLKDEFGSAEAIFMPYEHLYDLLQKAAICFKIDETKDPYVHHFFDVAFQYQLNRNAELLPFIDFVEQQKDKLALQLPESTESIRITTIHKAKGLEFPIVLIPSLDFTIEIYGYNNYLMNTNEGLAYCYPSKNIPEFKKFYDKELSAILLDKINLLYVALTRPEQRLYIWNHHKQKGFGAQIHEQILNLPFLESTEEHVYTYGLNLAIEFSKSDLEKQAAEQTKFYHPIGLHDQLWYPALAFRTPDIDREEDLLFGLAFHRVLSLCSSPQDLTSAINQALQEGALAIDQKKAVEDAANRFWMHVTRKKLNLDVIEEFNEQRIIADINQVKQPDKVWRRSNEIIVIDFKTGLRKEKHLQQISNYATLLSSIFKLPVRSILYYTQLDLFLEL